jgi:hypothetical protein
LLKVGTDIKGAEYLVESALDLIIGRLDSFKKSPEWALVAADASLLSVLLDRCTLK